MLPKANEFQCSNCVDCGHVKTIQVTAKVTRLGLPKSSVSHLDIVSKKKLRE